MASRAQGSRVRGRAPGRAPCAEMPAWGLGGGEVGFRLEQHPQSQRRGGARAGSFTSSGLLRAWPSGPVMPISKIRFCSYKNNASAVTGRQSREADAPTSVRQTGGRARRASGLLGSNPAGGIRAPCPLRRARPPWVSTSTPAHHAIPRGQREEAGGWALTPKPTLHSQAPTGPQGSPPRGRKLGLGWG